jgi:phosphatidylserine/phosphatidylglycerophosphate/cardiolipin synthase-like enzyme
MTFFFGLLPSTQSQAAEIHFSPGGGIRNQIISRIMASVSTIDIAAYSFSSKEIALALVKAKKRGVKIRVIRDMGRSKTKNDENIFLGQNGIKVQIRTGKGKGIMHDTFAIFDGRGVFTGSYNWTDNAEQNNWENAIYTSDRATVLAYKKEFEVLWKAPPPLPQLPSQPPSKSPSPYGKALPPNSSPPAEND